MIKNWKKLGLKRKSYVRIEMPIKLEEEQLDRKILNELVDMIYIIDKNNIKIEFKNI